MKSLFKIPPLIFLLVVIVFTLTSCKSKDKITSIVNGPKQVAITTPVVSSTTSYVRTIFNKSATDVMADLKNSNEGIPVIGDVSASITYGINSTSGFTPITVAKDFKIISSVEQKATPTDWQHLTLYIDANFILNAPNNMYGNNGTYNAKGQCKVDYKLDKNKNKWIFAQVISYPVLTSTKIK